MPILGAVVLTYLTDMEEAARHLALLTRTTEVVNSSLDLQEVLEAIAHEVAAALDTDACFVYLYDERADELVLRATHGTGSRMRHPHRGIETITYVLAGTVEHGDSMGNRGSIGAGDIQWMTAGRGIVHQEMPTGDAHGPHARLPALGQPARVAQDDGPALSGREGERRARRRRRRRHRGARSSAASYRGKRGPVDDVAAKPVYLDVSLPAGRRKILPVETTSHAFAYVFAGAGKFCNASQPLAVPTEPAGWADTTPPAEADNRTLVLFDSRRRDRDPGRRRRHSVLARLRPAARASR